MTASPKDIDRIARDAAVKMATILAMSLLAKASPRKFTPLEFRDVMIAAYTIARERVGRYRAANQSTTPRTVGAMVKLLDEIADELNAAALEAIDGKPQQRVAVGVELPAGSPADIAAELIKRASRF